MAISLAQLASVAGVEAGSGWANIDIADISENSNQIEEYTIFAARRGANQDGHAFAKQAIDAGAVALLVERPLGLGVSELVVDNSSHALGRIAAKIHGEPSSKLNLIGITGTNGKTSTASFLTQVLQTLGQRPISIGTLDGSLTTPSAPTLQRLLANAVAEAKTHVALEVSSHALSQGRVGGCRFVVSAFTNLGVDHLDYHDTIEDYFAAKKKLFAPELSELAVINTDDKFGARLANEVSIPTMEVSKSLVKSVDFQSQQSIFWWRNQKVTLPLAGRINLANALMAGEIALGLGFPEAEIARALSTLQSPPGRYQSIHLGQPFDVVVDYAHTPDALEAVLRMARGATSGSLLVVFGAGGNRQHSKRPTMGKIARQYGDWVAVTTDNPRNENPEDIIAEICAGMPLPPEAIEVDRRKAIALAISEAKAGDLVLIAGKGHETTQDFGTHTIPFDDRQVAKEILQARLGVGP